jgi:hypothetical protein
MADLKQTFILRALADYNQSVIDTMEVQMRKLKVQATGEGLKSLAYKVVQSGGGAYSNLSFKEYLRFVDMGVGRGHPLGGLASVKVALQASRKEGLAFVKDKTFKPKKIYAKIAYGKLSHLTGKLLYGYTEEAIALLKAELESKPLNSKL